jgi:hypothetical protein
LSTASDVSDVVFTAASGAQLRTGLLGWVSFVLANVLVVESVAVRRTHAGRLTLSYPRRTDRHGNARYDVRPRDDAARLDLELQVFAGLGFTPEEAAP